MSNELETMVTIQNEADNRPETDMLPLDAEGKTLAEHKRYTFDVVETPVDPLR